ncbi:MAG: hypothetical protein RBT49_10695 [Bacteroidales bacterium]|jgi:hypothetical protein|nr:hypothetical protein [Bacteroidales bacterium]
MEKRTEFQHFINSLTVVDYYETRKKIMHECKITEHQFRHWKNGRTRIPELAKEKINEIAGKTVFS